MTIMMLMSVDCGLQLVTKLFTYL